MYLRAIFVLVVGIALAINRLWIPAAASVLLAIMILLLNGLGRQDRMG